MLAAFISFFLFFLPFQFALSPGEGIDLPLGRILAILIFFWWLVRALMRKSLWLPSPVVTGSILSFLFLASVSLLWAENGSFALRKLLFLLNFFPLLFVFYDLLEQDRKNLYTWTGALVLGASTAALFSLTFFGAQFLTGVGTLFAWLTQDIFPFFLGHNLSLSVQEYPSLLVNIGGATLLRATAFFPDPHVTSFYFGMTAFLALGLFFQTKQKYFLAGAAILFLADLLTFSRGGYLGLVVGAATFLVLSWGALTKKARKIITGTFFLLAALFFSFGQPIISRFTSSFSFADTSSTERVVLWQTAIKNIEERPLLGTGLGNYILAVKPDATYRLPYYAHNLYLDIAVELGLLGLFLFLLIIATAYSNVLKNLRIRNTVFLQVTSLSALTLYLTHSLFETALYSVHILPLLLFVLAVAYHKEKNTYATPPSK